jgi:hypothetical protein
MLLILPNCCIYLIVAYITKLLHILRSEDAKSSIDLKMFDTEDSKSSDPNDCYHHIEKVSTSIQMFSIFIISLIITN